MGKGTQRRKTCPDELVVPHRSPPVAQVNMKDRSDVGHSKPMSDLPNKGRVFEPALNERGAAAPTRYPQVHLV
jgi:hypothetical protein